MDDPSPDASAYLCKYALPPPELLFHEPFGLPVDVWTMGLILLKLASDNRDWAEHLYSDRPTPATKLLGNRKYSGELPLEYLQKFKQLDGIDVADVDRRDYKEAAMFMAFREEPKGFYGNDLNFSVEDHMALVDLVKKMMAYRQEERITAEEALRHEFFACERPTE